MKVSSFHPVGRHGFMAMDTIAGLCLLLALSTVLLYAASLRQRSAQRLGEQRRALEAARMTLTRLQTHQPDEPENAMIRVVRAGMRVGDMEWAEVTASVGRGRASISGLIPATQPTTRPEGAP